MNSSQVPAPYPPHADPRTTPLEHCLPRALPRRENQLILGIFQPNQSWSFWPTTAPTETSWTYPYNREVVQLADELGFSFAFPAARWKGLRGDRIDWRGASLDTITLTAALLEATRRITLLTTIHTNVFNPVVAAKIGADLDHIGQGRWGLNIVSGWGVHEFEAMGVPLLSHAERYRYTSEWLDIVQQLWETGTCSYDGEYFHIREAEVRPRPMQRGGPLCVNAGQSYTGLRFAATRAHYAFTHARNAGRLRAIADEVGSTAGVIGTIRVIVRPTRDEANDLASEILRHVDVGAVRSMMIASGAHTPESADEKLREEGAVSSSVMEGAVIGAPDDVARHLAGLAETGHLDGLCLTLYDYRRDLELFGREVVPLLQEFLIDKGITLCLTTNR